MVLNFAAGADQVTRKEDGNMENERPKFVKAKHLEFLDELRESGVTNMYGATPYIQSEFPNLGREKATEVLSYWMRTFSERHMAARKK